MIFKRLSADGWTTDDLVFLWKEGDPVQVVKNLHLPRFTLEKFLTDYCNSKTNTGRSSTLNYAVFIFDQKCSKTINCNTNEIYF